MSLLSYCTTTQIALVSKRSEKMFTIEFHLKSDMNLLSYCTTTQIALVCENVMSTYNVKNVKLYEKDCNTMVGKSRNIKGQPRMNSPWVVMNNYVC